MIAQSRLCTFRFLASWRKCADLYLVSAHAIISELPAAMKIVLISTYELGRQPFGLASPAAWLCQTGAEVACLDLSREPFREGALRDAARCRTPKNNSETKSRRAYLFLRPLRAGE